MPPVTQHSLLRRQLRAAWLPAALFAACAVGFVTNRGTEGSPVIWRGEYALAQGHGEYRVTDRATYEAVRRRGRWQLAFGAGMVVSAVAAASLIRRAGLPYAPTPVVSPSLRPPV
jgi:hypothetical protein